MLCPNLGMNYKVKDDLNCHFCFSHKCSHAVMATSALSKEEVHVLWTAPEMGSGCINLKAMVVERNDFWFMDDGGYINSNNVSI